MEIKNKEAEKPKNNWTENQLERFAKMAFWGSIIGFFLGVIGLVIEILVFIYANRALKSSNQDTVKRAKKAKNIAIIYFIFNIIISLFILVKMM